MELKGKKAMILVEQMYNDYEFIYPYYRLLESGAETYVVGPEADKKYPGKEGTQASSNLSAAQADPQAFSVMVIPGGYAPDHMRRHRAMVDLVREMYGQGKIIAAICHAGWLPASAGILKGKKMTSFFAIKDDLIHAGAQWVDEEVVVDGNLITSRTPDDLPAFMRTVIARTREL
ncbi:type 1 glutamine amidotransferase domain-containing protein [Desulfonatronovibrio hydrogenovorans]|uniref:type 1 glutamine amidotransferase domain-containing protein n=1 Tax=Desulfonatronovibrio hydrogenovorans TaxID=53245 RepID=UPI000491F4DA|nr:type 1 glutamine amidotransferase domain-containing protein [Desulfonatronovibrio hydrogenovorans]